MANPSQEQRKAEAEMREAHVEAQREVIAANAERQDELAEFSAHTPGEKADITRRRELQMRADHLKSQRGPAANKARTPATENKADLEDMTKAELETLAERRGVTVRGTGSGGNVLKADLVKALS